MWLLWRAGLPLGVQGFFKISYYYFLLFFYFLLFYSSEVSKLWPTGWLPVFANQVLLEHNHTHLNKTHASALRYLQETHFEYKGVL